jgi:hypothetical protein
MIRCEQPFNIYFLRKMKPLNIFFWGCENVQNLLGQVNSLFGDKDINQTFLKRTLISGMLIKYIKMMYTMPFY